MATANSNLNPVRLANDLVDRAEHSPGMTDMMDLYGVGDHGGGPTRAMLDEGLHWMQPDKVIPKDAVRHRADLLHRCGEADRSGFADLELRDRSRRGYAASPRRRTGKISIPTWKDELYLEYHRGVSTTQANHKRNMRDSEEWALNAEKYASLAWLDGKPIPQRADRCLEEGLFNRVP